MNQPDLFDVGERLVIQRPKREPCTPAPIGSGPEGETCKTCQHYTRARWHDSYWLKCGLMRQHWTHGPGTDIKAGWAACRYFEKIE